MCDGLSTHVMEMSQRLQYNVTPDKSLVIPLNLVVPGRRLNGPSSDVPAMCMYGPIHYQELPEILMDLIPSLTGKSASTTGFGREGALTKGPFNALLPVYDMNQILVSYLLTGHDGFTSAAGVLGPNIKIDHDVSLLIPEIFSRLTPEERTASYLVSAGMMAKVPPLQYNGHDLPVSRLGYRITSKFVSEYFGKIFDDPAAVFDDYCLKPETQDIKAFAEGLNKLVETQSIAAQEFFDDGSIDVCNTY